MPHLSSIKRSVSVNKHQIQLYNVKMPLVEQILLVTDSSILIE